MMSDYFTWRIHAIKVLEDVLNQQADCCWAIAVIRQLIAMLKMDGSLTKSQTLSIQYVIDGLPRKQINERGALIKFEEVGEFLKNEGTVLEQLCPLTCKVDEIRQLLCDAHKYRVSKFTVWTPFDYPDQEAFEEAIHRQLRFGPIAVSIPVFDSFKGLVGFDEVYSPTKTELDAYRSGSKIFGFHSMLLTGDGYDENGVRFFEFQDSKGTQWGENGFIKIACDLGIYVNFVEMKRLTKSPKYLSAMNVDPSDMEM